MLSWTDDIPIGSDDVEFRVPKPEYRTRRLSSRWLGYATFKGLDVVHTRGHLVSAVMEGLASTLSASTKGRNDGLDVMVLTGGASRHPRWARVMSDEFQLPVRHLLESDASAKGAALLAALGSDPSIERVGWIELGPVVYPDQDSPLLIRQCTFD
jgi:xylulokinase